MEYYIWLSIIAHIITIALLFALVVGLGTVEESIKKEISNQKYDLYHRLYPPKFESAVACPKKKRKKK